MHILSSLLVSLIMSERWYKHIMFMTLTVAQRAMWHLSLREWRLLWVARHRGFFYNFIDWIKYQRVRSPFYYYYLRVDHQFDFNLLGSIPNWVWGVEGNRIRAGNFLVDWRVRSSLQCGRWTVDYIRQFIDSSINLIPNRSEYSALFWGFLFSNSRGIRNSLRDQQLVISIYIPFKNCTFKYNY